MVPVEMSDDIKYLGIYYSSREPLDLYMIPVEMSDDIKYLGIYYSSREPLGSLYDPRGNVR